MGKKNKKNTKINQRIRKYFDDDPFDVGVERVEAEVLSELFHTLGIYDIEFSKEIMIKTARMLWSEADSDYRQDILNFFIANETIYPSNKPKRVEMDRHEKLEELVSELDASVHEEALLIDSFMGMRSKKITITKIEAKLRHIRLQEKKDKLQKALDGVFDIDDSLEFNASLRYKIFAQHFHKILTLNTKPYEIEYLQNAEFDEIFERISNDKEKIVELKQRAIEKFIRELEIPHPYLTDKEIEGSLRANPPKTKLDYPVLKTTILRSLIDISLDVQDLVLHEQEILVRVHESIKLPFSDIH
ncbi:MAG: helicase, partial [Sulfurimonas sp.]|nr:helicase [Sulfurimonas sp.]